MPTVGKRRGGLALRGLALGLLLLTARSVAPSYAQESACRYFSGLPDDCAGAELRRFDNLRDYRYQEIELFAKDPLKKVVYVSVYDTTGLNGGDDTRELGAGGARPKTGRQEDREAIPGAGDADRSSLLLDGGLACRSGWRGQEFRRPQCGVEGK